MRISEVFKGLQGEGVSTGLPTVFVRLAGCNLYPNGCKWCFVPETLVTMSDYTTRPLGEVKVGDNVLGVDETFRYVPTTVLKVLTRRDNVVDIGGVVTGTPNHPFLVDGSWQPVRSGTRLRFSGRPPQDWKEFHRGWLAGYVAGDGNFHDFLGAPNGKPYLRFKVCSKDEELITTTIDYAGEGGFELRRIVHNAGMGAFRPGNLLDGAECTRSKVCENFRSYLYDLDETPDYARGFLAGAFDAEGNSDVFGDCKLRIRFSQKTDSPLALEIREYAKILGFELYEFSGEDGMSAFLIYDAVRFYVECPPVLKRKIGYGRTVRTSRQSVVVDAIGLRGLRDVVNLETICGSFVAGGFVVHNCDTPYAQGTNGKEMSVGEIMKTVDDLSDGCRRVCLTGGEPLHQVGELRDLVDELCFRNYFIEVFTNSTLARPDWFFLVDSWVVDIKCPSSGVSDKCLLGLWLGTVRECDLVKFVVADHQDLGYVKSVLGRFRTRA